MPKIVNHAQRREHIVQAAWRLIGREGFSAATMRDVAAEAGFANGAIKPYFATKQDLLHAVYVSAVERTNERAQTMCEGLSGRAAIEAFAGEVLPLREASRAEAAGVLAFWSEASGDPKLSAIHGQAMQSWRSRIAQWASQAQEVGELTNEVSAASMAGALVGFLLGAQIVLTVEPEHASEGTLRAQLTAILDGFSVATPVTSTVTS